MSIKNIKVILMDTGRVCEMDHVPARCMCIPVAKWGMAMFDPEHICMTPMVFGSTRYVRSRYIGRNTFEYVRA